jgi:hypothetical protein
MAYRAMGSHYQAKPVEALPKRTGVLHGEVCGIPVGTTHDPGAIIGVGRLEGFGGAGASQDGGVGLV